ncbi:MAG: calcium/sodium antiporter [Cyclobacteriaceae bacterium]|nr:calcium/sodium antiporter [Cyclobacteriaceae bacterium]
MALVGFLIALIISFYLLAEVSDRYFVVSLDKISQKFNMSHDMAGATFMAIGSSAPELFVSIIALVRPGDHAAIGVGTIVGSALFNLLVIVGAVAIVKNAVIAWQPVIRDLLFYGLAILGLYYVLYDGRIEYWEGALLISVYGVYLYAVLKWKKWFNYEELDADPEEETDEEKTGWKVVFKPLDWFLARFFRKPEHFISNFTVSILMIAFLCWILVESAIGIAHILDIPEIVIALTVLAVGTSVPDMVSSVIVAKQGRAGMAVSNAIGSNIFDIFIGLGIPWFIKYLITGNDIIFDIQGLDISVGLLFGSVILILFFLIWKKWKLTQNLGFILILLYILYVIWEIFRFYLPQGASIGFLNF